MSPPVAYDAWRHRFSLLLAASTALLILWGAMVTSKDAGLSVPDWPKAYGYWWLPVDMWIGNIFWEHTHRLVAATIGFLTLVLAFWTAWREPRAWVRRLAWVALAAVIIQGILGGVTVHMMLPVAVSSMHATLAQIFFCLTLTLAFVTRRRFVEGDAGATPHARPLAVVRGGLALALLAIFAQLVLGAVMRHSTSGLAVPDFPTAYGAVVPGQVFPALDDASIAAYNAYLASADLSIYNDAYLRTSRGRIVIHMMHRLWAFGVLAIVLGVAIVLVARHRAERWFLRGGLVLGALILVQFTLGIVTVLTHRDPLMTSLHVVVGALTLGTTYTLLLRSFELRDAAAVDVVGADAAAAREGEPARRGAGGPAGGGRGAGIRQEGGAPA